MLLDHLDPRSMRTLILDSQKITHISQLVSPPANDEEEEGENSLSSYSGLELLSLNNTTLISLEKFPHLPLLKKVGEGRKGETRYICSYFCTESICSQAVLDGQQTRGTRSGRHNLST